VRQKELYDAGLKSLTELEQRQQSFQDARAKRLVAENKFYNSKNELLNIRLELSGVEQEYAEKISKASGDRFTALSQVSVAEGEIAKLKNQFANYSQRRKFYVITAPQAGQVVRTVKAGLGEIVKEGEHLLQIVPTEFSPAVEIKIPAVDMALVQKGQKVRLQFDGFPAIVFSGWPQASYGTFGGNVSAIDPSIDPDGTFRMWVVPDGKRPWPKQLRYGGGARGIALLKDVPIIYELWRQLNGFPAEYYQSGATEKKEKHEK
jgi:multidrug resistance efflux pump